MLIEESKFGPVPGARLNYVVKINKQNNDDDDDFVKLKV